MNNIFELIDNSDYCQFVYNDFKELLEKKRKMVPALETIKFRLRDKYNEQLLILPKPGGRIYFVLMESTIDILYENFYSKGTVTLDAYSDDYQVVRTRA